MQTRFRLLFTVLFLTGMITPAISAAPKNDDFSMAISSLCASGRIAYSDTGDFVMRKTLNNRDVTPQLILGLSYAKALTGPKGVKTSAFVNRANAETALREFLEGLGQLSTIDKARLKELKKKNTCGFRDDDGMAELISNALKSMNNKRFVYLKADTKSNGGIYSAHDRSRYRFEGYFLLGPSSDIGLPELVSKSKENEKLSIFEKSRQFHITYDLAGNKPTLRMNWDVERTPALEQKSIIKLDSKFYTLRVKEMYRLGKTRFFYALLTSDNVYTDGIKGKLVAVEAGHWLEYFDRKKHYPDPGSNYKELINEVDINKKIKEKLIPLLVQSGAKILRDPKKNEPDNKMRYDRTETGSSGDMEWDVGYAPLVRWLNYQYDKGNKVQAFVSIHHNVLGDGLELHDYTESYWGGRSRNLGRALMEEVKKSTKSGSNLRKQLIPSYKNGRSQYVNGVKGEIPNALVEVEFTNNVFKRITDKQEKIIPKKFDEYAIQAAKGIYYGLTRFFKGDTWPPVPEFPFNEKALSSQDASEQPIEIAESVEPEKVATEVVQDAT